VPASLKLQQEHGDALQVLFVEVQGADMEKTEAFAWRQKWMGTRAMWTTERPLDYWACAKSFPRFLPVAPRVWAPSGGIIPFRV